MTSGHAAVVHIGTWLCQRVPGYVLIDNWSRTTA